ncbi:MAG: histidine phosphatase family protein [Pseudomonadota bacterium]
MTSCTLFLVRHGQAAAGFDSHRDPALDELGHQQAQENAEHLAERLAPIPVLSSPIRRARETAAPLAARWQQDVLVSDAISEIPSPDPDLKARAAWLRDAMAGPWTALPEAQRIFREQLIEFLASQTQDQVLFSHFVAINLAVGAATGDDRMVVFRPSHVSVTELIVDAGQLRLGRLGAEAETRVN